MKTAVKVQTLWSVHESASEQLPFLYIKKQLDVSFIPLNPSTIIITLKDNWTAPLLLTQRH